MHKDEKEVYNLMKPYARFSSKAQHEELCKALVDEKRLQKKIQELAGY